LERSAAHRQGVRPLPVARSGLFVGAVFLIMVAAKP
jgi:hypothetical protein